MLTRKLSGARTEAYLRKAWEEVRERRLDSNAALEKLFDEKLAELRSTTEKKASRAAAGAVG